MNSVYYLYVYGVFFMDYDDEKLMIPTVEWMSEKYNEMNEQLFDGKLMGCSFNIFTHGKGSNGGVLGWFTISRSGVKYNKKTRIMFSEDEYWGDREYVSYDNFEYLCKPMIELNGNYKWTEKAALSTLVHEMCHYYTYMHGYAPRQAHGVEFRKIAQYVSSKSDGVFTVQRLANAEQMSEMALNPEIQAKNNKREENKKNRIIPVFVFEENNNVELTNANSKKLVDYIVDYNKRKNENVTIKIGDDLNLNEFLFKLGYKKAMTTYRYWDIGKKGWLPEINKFKLITVYDTRQKESETEPQKETDNNKIKHFVFNLINGGKFEARNVTKDELRNLLRQRFPKWPESSIDRVMNTEKYFVNENLAKMIEEEVRKQIKELSSKKNNDNKIEELPVDINLGITDLN